MSVITVNTRRTSASSILRRTSMKTKLLERERPKVRFTFPHTKKVRHILQNFAAKQNIREYENLVCLIRDSHLLDDDLSGLLTEATQCISLLNQDLRLFVEAILIVNWVSFSDNVISQYQSFIINLLSAHNYHAKFAIDTLIAHFLPDPEQADWADGVPPFDDLKKSVNVHCVINSLLSIIPMCQDILLHSIVHHYPYFTKSSHTHEVYLHNLLCILDYRPQLQPDILHLIFSKLVLLDVNAPKEEIERLENEMEVDVFEVEDKFNCDTMKHPVAHILDISLLKIFNHFLVLTQESGELNWEKAKNLKPTITEAFLNFLWRKVCNPNVASIHRHTAVSYIASLIARGSFVPLYMLKGTLQQMSNWIHSYIVTQDELGCINSDIRIHVVFYSVCQALFYMIAFRHKDLVHKKKDIVFLESLNLSKMVTCCLNPLRVCQPAIVQNFASVARTYQLAYCYAVIEHNSRNVIPTIYQDEKGSVMVSNNTLDSFFPFDPYILKKSKEIIEPLYVYYHANSENSTEDYDMVEKDDFLAYGTSLGFKHRN